MALFNKTEIGWSEPLFFLIRIREGWGWRNRILIALGSAILIFLAMFLTQAGMRTHLEEAAIALAAGVFILFLMDYGNLQREISVHKDSIIVTSTMGKNWFTTIEYDRIESISLTRPEEWQRTYGGMILNFGDGEGFMIAVPTKVSLDTLANILNRLEQSVELSGWEPSDSDTRIQVKDDLELDPEEAVGHIDTHPIGDQEVKLNSGFDMAIQIVIALWPLLLVPGGSVWLGIDIYQNKEELSWLNIGLRIGGVFVLFIISFIYLMRVGQFVAAAYGVSVARKNMRSRAESLFDAAEENLVTVELFERESWTKVTAMAVDFGFLKLDRDRKQLRFEGNKNRWTMPLSALQTCRIEESIVGAEGEQGAEKRYYVVLAADKLDGTLWEYGLIYTRTEIGKDEYEVRHERAKLLLNQLAEIM